MNDYQITHKIVFYFLEKQKQNRKNVNKTISLKFLNRVQRRIQDPRNIQDGNLPDISP